MTFRLQPVALAVSTLVLGLSQPVMAQQAKADDKKDQAQTIEVTGIRASIERSLNTKRAADTNIEAVSAEDVGKMPDKNIADALSRLPGVNVQYGGALAMDEAERVAIRGTSPNLNLVTVNGHALSSGDWHVGDQAGSGRREAERRREKSSRAPVPAAPPRIARAAPPKPMSAATTCKGRSRAPGSSTGASSTMPSGHR
jgi:iron complex outermembrane receptor protein